MIVAKEQLVRSEVLDLAVYLERELRLVRADLAHHPERAARRMAFSIRAAQRQSGRVRRLARIA